MAVTKGTTTIQAGVALRDRAQGLQQWRRPHGTSSAAATFGALEALGTYDCRTTVRVLRGATVQLQMRLQKVTFAKSCGLRTVNLSLAVRHVFRPEVTWTDATIGQGICGAAGMSPGTSRENRD